jgi:hypothetical protein
LMFVGLLGCVEYCVFVTNDFPVSCWMLAMNTALCPLKLGEITT